MKQVLNTDKAPKAIGTYSQAVRVGNLVFISGQIPLNPETMELEQGFTEQTHRVFKNLQAICQEAGGDLANIVKLNIYVTDLANFAELNDIMGKYFSAPYPARAAVQISALPKGAMVEMEAVFAD